MPSKLDMHTRDITQDNIKNIGALFPHCVTEAIDNRGRVRHVIDFEMLKQELSEDIVSGISERYQFIWPNKLKFQNLANMAVDKTLRPCREESLEFDKTHNLYIEGDNLDALKLLRETYLSKIDVIYIDPPYNTGNDFVYNDDYKMNYSDFRHIDGSRDDRGYKLFKNTDSNGRFHTDWLNMMYPRLRLARDLLSNEGLILISIDENESHNLKKICDEIFGERNYIGDVVRKTKSMTGDSVVGFNLQHEYLQIYAKNKNEVLLQGEEKDLKNYSNRDDDINGDWCAGDPSAKSGGDSTYFPITNPYTGKVDYPPSGRYWAFSKRTLERYVDTGKIKFKNTHAKNERGFIFKRYKSDLNNLFNPVNSLFAIENEYMNSRATAELSELFDGSIFDYPKPVEFVKKIIKYATRENSIVLDFFSGSATTAHAIMELNAEDGYNRRYIMIQLPESVDLKSDVYSKSYKDICEIGKERIRLSGKQILKENKQRKLADDSHFRYLDVGFRVLKLDSSNMKDVYYTPDDTFKHGLDELLDNVKEDRTPEDLLFQVMLELGIELSATIKEDVIEGKKIFNVDENYLIACFDDNVSEDVITKIAKTRPHYTVMRDNSMSDDNVAVNFEQIFKTYSPDTIRKVL